MVGVPHALNRYADSYQLVRTVWGKNSFKTNSLRAEMLTGSFNLALAHQTLGAQISENNTDLLAFKANLLSRMKSTLHPRLFVGSKRDRSKSLC